MDRLENWAAGDRVVKQRKHEALALVSSNPKHVVGLNNGKAALQRSMWTGGCEQSQQCACVTKKADRVLRVVGRGVVISLRGMIVPICSAQH